jgi:SAM-dependent methyltransferase
MGYEARDLRQLPEGASMGLSCGNPVALASLEAGEVVLDLGSGGGLDVFIAGQRVGSTGHAIGVDMTPEMVARARAGIAAYRERTGLDNVEFRLGEIEHLPVADCSVDVVISNCVINLSPDKPQVWREVARVLRPGGRVAVSDLALLKPLPDAVRESSAALTRCVAGAVLIEDVRRMVTEAGLKAIRLVPDASYVEAALSCERGSSRKLADVFPEGTDPADYVVSLSIAAARPERCFGRGSCEGGDD